ncbi:glycosyltransferase family 2 protein [uncultured Hymenobacter sp.]|uniref:glycosyltransferase family 2 protein n=1 Tax=uncultured Hymenobacter sp. TaxID=170016 RepID=UPI0035CA6BE4
MPTVNYNRPLLTVVIPTYNRNEKLRHSIDILVPQLNEHVIIKVIDNASLTPVRETLDHHAKNPSVEIIRNQYNVGVSTNLIKCFESCDTEWMWLLGDDDPPSTDAIDGILNDLHLNKDCSFLNYKSAMTSNRNESFYTVGIEELINKVDHFGNLLFISVGVYNLHTLKADIRLTHQLSYCLAPHLVYLLSAISSNTKVGFLARRIHDASLHNTSAEESWSWISLSLCFPILFEIPLDISERTRNMFANHVLTHVKSPSDIYELLEQPKYYEIPTSKKRFLLRQIYFRSLLYRGLDKYFLSFLYYDTKLIIKDMFVKREVKNHLERDERL